MTHWTVFTYEQYKEDDMHPEFYMVKGYSRGWTNLTNNCINPIIIVLLWSWFEKADLTQFNSLECST